MGLGSKKSVLENKQSWEITGEKRLGLACLDTFKPVSGVARLPHFTSRSRTAVRSDGNSKTTGRTPALPKHISLGVPKGNGKLKAVFTMRDKNKPHASRRAKGPPRRMALPTAPTALASTSTNIKHINKYTVSSRGLTPGSNYRLNMFQSQWTPRSSRGVMHDFMGGSYQIRRSRTYPQNGFTITKITMSTTSTGGVSLMIR